MDAGPVVRKVTAFANTRRPFTGFQSVVRRRPARACSNPYRERRPKTHKDFASGVRLYRSGRMLIVDATSIDAAREALDAAAQEVGEQAYDFEVLGIVASWDIITPGVPANSIYQPPGMQYITVHTLSHNNVVCAGATTLAEVDLVYAMYH